MQHQIGTPRRRRVLLVLAMTASVMQVFGSALPSLVVCHRADRPPRLEFFSDSCSCRQADPHSCSPRSGHDAPCLEEDCTDVHLKSHLLPASRPLRLGASLKGQRRVFGPEAPISGVALSSRRPAADERGLPRAESPPPLSPPGLNSRLRC